MTQLFGIYTSIYGYFSVAPSILLYPERKRTVHCFFDMLGYDIVISEEYGMIALNNSFGTGRIRLRLLDSIILLLLRLLFIEEKKKLSQTEQVIVYVDELYERYRGLKNERLKATPHKAHLTALY